MNIIGFCIFNATRNAWLQDDERSWGSFAGAVEFMPEHFETAEGIRERESGDDVTYTMAVL
jgi:hypothetical protein